MRIYKLYKPSENIDAAFTINEDGSMTSFIFDENNPDYRQYLAWLDAGNVPLPADEVNTN